MRDYVLLFLITVSITLAACGDGRSRGPVGDAAFLPDGSVPMGDAATTPDGTTPVGDGSVAPDASMVDSPLVDPTCVDGMYAETLPNPSASIDDLLSGYEPAEFQTFIDGILDRRYPIGAYVVRGGRTNTDFGGDCDALFVGSPTPTVDQVFQRLGTIVHECGHLYDFTLGGRGSGYAIREDLTLTGTGGDSTDRGGNTFPRSELTTDEYYPMRPACGSDPCDFYADTYLIGRGSEQGFNLLLEEATQYVNSLATAYAFTDRVAPGRRGSAKDGILTFLWYVERYLRIARTRYPDAYDFILGSAEWRELILTIWGRGWLFLELTRDVPALGISDDVLFPFVEDAELVAEIQRVRDAHGCGI